MNTHFVCSVAFVLAVMGAAQAGSPLTTTDAKVKRTQPATKVAARKPAPVAAAVAQSQGWQPPKEHWNWRRAAMQPFRFIVMAAKIPCSIAGYPVIVLAYAASHKDIPDPGEFFANFDPGPAIDADLEGYRPAPLPVQEFAPTPVRTTVRPLGTTSAATRSGANVGLPLGHLSIDPMFAPDFRVSGPLLDMNHEASGVKPEAILSIAGSASLTTPVSSSGEVLSQK